MRKFKAGEEVWMVKGVGYRMVVIGYYQSWVVCSTVRGIVGYPDLKVFEEDALTNQPQEEWT